MTAESTYYVPPQSHWPIIGSVALTTTVIGAVNFIHSLKSATGASDLWLGVLFTGFLLLAFMMYGWFGTVIKENYSGLYSKQLDRSFRWGMAWFIFSEVMFFAAFFGALFYARNFSIPWLAGEGNNAMTHALIWPEFSNVWPLVNNPNPEEFTGPKWSMGAWGLPALNTLILLTSGVTVTWAHWGIIKANRSQIILGLAATVALGYLFLFFQAEEYIHAYKHLGLTLDSGIYGTTFFMLTGFHGAHVTIGAIMLTVMLIRSLKGHFSPENHFAFEAAAWYWHFVDVVWLGLFVFVYCL